GRHLVEALLQPLRSDGSLRRRLQALDEQAQLALLDGERALDRQQSILQIRRTGGLRRDGLQFQANAGERLQHAVVEVPGELNSIFANGDLPETIGQVQLVERVADLPRDHFDDRLQVIGRWIDAGEKHTSHEMFSAKRQRSARSMPEYVRPHLVEVTWAVGPVAG